MNKYPITALDALNFGENGIFVSYAENDELQRRLKALGLTSGTEITALKNHTGGITAYRFRGTYIALNARQKKELFVIKKSE